MSQSTIVVTGNSLDQALLKAAGNLGTSQDDIHYRVVKTRGQFLSLFAGKKVEIEAWKKSERRGGQRNSRRSSSPQGERRSFQGGKQSRRFDRQARPERFSFQKNEKSHGRDSERVELSSEQQAELIEELRGFCAGMCAKMLGEKVKVSTELNEERLLINIESDDLEVSFQKNQKLAEAFEHILRKKPRHIRQELPFRIFVDVNRMRVRREEDLVQMARDLSEQVSENQRPIVLNYKSSYDRKIIHMTLDKNDRVYTKSIGNGPNRKLMILPIRTDNSDAHRESFDDQEPWHSANQS